MSCEPTVMMLVSGEPAPRLHVSVIEPEPAVTELLLNPVTVNVPARMSEMTEHALLSERETAEFAVKVPVEPVHFGTPEAPIGGSAARTSIVLSTPPTHAIFARTPT